MQQFESIQLKRGDESKADAYTGPAGEIVVDTTNWTLRLQDGQTSGGTQAGTPQ